VPNRRTVSLAICLCAAFTTLLDQSSLNTALPSLRTALDAGPGTLQWIVAGYSLTFGLALVPAGRLGDAHGRKWLFVGGLSVFTAASVVGGTAESAWVVALARLLQGVGAGTVNPQIFGIIQELFTGRERTRALAAYATVGGISGVIGPLVGGTVIGALGEQHGWRWVMLLNVPFGLITVPLALKWLPTTARRPGTRPALDLAGLALLATATLAVLLPFVLPDGQGPPRFWWPVVAAAALVTLIAWERRYARSGRTPILLPALLGSRGFSLGALTAMFQFGATMSASLALTLFLQDGLGWSPLHAALTILPSSLGFAIASSQSWRLVSRYGRISVVWALTGSFVTLAVTAAVIGWVPAGQIGIALTVTQLAMGVSGGLIISPNQALTLAHAPASAAGLAGGFLQVSQRISATIATAAVAGVVLAGITAGVAREAVAHGLVICVAMLALATVCAALDVRGREFTPPRPVLLNSGTAVRSARPWGRRGPSSGPGR
jgi:MFS family permease